MPTTFKLSSDLFFDLDQELEQLNPVRQFDAPWQIPKHEYTKLGPLEIFVKSRFYSVGEHVLHIFNQAQRGEGAIAEPTDLQFMLSRRVVQAARNKLFVPGTNKPINYHACPRSELGFARDVASQASPGRPAKRRAAVVLSDTAGVPMAYQKRSGLSSAYVFRGGVIRTEAGDCYLPEESVVRFWYGPDRSYSSKEGLSEDMSADTIKLVDQAPQDVTFLRFGLTEWPDMLRGLILDAGNSKGLFTSQERGTAYELDAQMISQYTNGVLAFGDYKEL